MASEVGGGSSRSHEGRRGKLHCTPEAKPTIFHRQGCLGPCRGVGLKVDICNGPHDGSQSVVVQCQVGREKTRRSPKGVQELWDGKRMAK